MTVQQLNRISKEILEAFIAVHRKKEPGFHVNLDVGLLQDGFKRFVDKLN